MVAHLATICVISMNKNITSKPWGNFIQFCNNESCTVKIIHVNPNEQLSLQYHHDRDEFWRVLSGAALVQIGEEMLKASEGDEFMIPRLAKHRIKTEDSTVRILEISFGRFDEKDIVRLEDKYGRVKH